MIYSCNDVIKNINNKRWGADMRHFRLYQVTVETMSAIPAGVTTLILSFNHLENKTGAELAVAFAAIPTSVTTLVLSNSELGNKTGAELAAAFAAIPAGVTALYLGVNSLGNKTGAELAIAFAAIPAGVTTLDLGGNGLGNKTGAELAIAFAAIPNTVKKVISNELDTVAHRTTLEQCNLYLNFRKGEYARYDALDIDKITEHVAGFCDKSPISIAYDLGWKISSYLPQRDLVNLRLVCKGGPAELDGSGSGRLQEEPKAQQQQGLFFSERPEARAITKNNTYCGFKSGFLLNRKRGLFNN